MSTETELKGFEKVDKALIEFELDPRRGQLYREQHGKVSMKPTLEPVLEEINKIRAIARLHAKDVHDAPLHEMTGCLEEIHVQLDGQAKREDKDWMKHRELVLSALRSALDKAKTPMQAFVTETVLQSGLLGHAEAIVDGVRRAEGELRKAIEEVTKDVQTETQAAIKKVREISQAVMRNARETAMGISVQAAQKQFAEAQTRLDKATGGWGAAAALAVVAFFGVLVWFYNDPIEFSRDGHWTTFAYRAMLRLLILSGVTALSTFFFKMLRAHMHMSQLNSHRQRVANSMQAFVEAAYTPEQRDLILGNLVEAVVAFGNSGLLTRDADTLAGQKQPTDAVLKALMSSKG